MVEKGSPHHEEKPYAIEDKIAIHLHMYFILLFLMFSYFLCVCFLLLFAAHKVQLESESQRKVWIE